MNQKLRELSRDPAKAENLLYALRHANDGYAITVWRDGGWCLWKPLDSEIADRASIDTDNEVLVTILVAELATTTQQDN